MRIFLVLAILSVFQFLSEYTGCSNPMLVSALSGGAEKLFIGVIIIVLFQDVHELIKK